MKSCIQSVILFSTLLAGPAVFAAAEYQVLHCQASAKNDFKIDLSISRQIRDNNGNFVQTGALKASVQFFQAVTGSGTVDLKEESTMNWKPLQGSNREDTAYNNVAKGTDGSFYFSKRILKQTLMDEIYKLPELPPTPGNHVPDFNDVHLYYLSIPIKGSQDNSVIYVTIQETEFNYTPHLVFDLPGLAAGLQTDAPCTYSSRPTL